MPLQATSGAASQDAFGGNGVAVVPTFIEDTFSCFLFTGTETARSITNDIDLSTKGGLVWIKGRNAGYDNNIIDTATGSGLRLRTNSAVLQAAAATGVTSFNTNGFSLGTSPEMNGNTVPYVSWTFRKQPKFFDIQTWTGSGANRTISHSLGSVPACIMVKRTDTTGDWQVYHRSLANTEYLVLNTDAAKATGATRWNSTTPTSSVFSLGTDATVNASAGTYVAYIFAHDAGGFGLTGTDNVISCGSFTGNGNNTITLGYEPQFILLRRVSSAGNDWELIDTMRGASVSTGSQVLYANSSAAEGVGGTNFPTATGFFSSSYGSGDIIYIAIRRPMKVPTTGTSVFAPATHTGTGTAISLTSAGFPPDLFWSANRDTIRNRSSHDRLRGIGLLLLNSTAAEDTGYTNSLTSFNMTGISVGTDSSAQTINNSAKTYAHYYFRRAPSFMDVVCYTGTGSATTFSHNLQAVPELYIVKGRSGATDWQVYSSALANTEYVVLNTTAAKATGATRWNSTTPTSSVFSIGTASEVNTSAATYVAYLFATCAGVSKVGSYTGTGTTKQIDCGFTAGARFVLIKRIDSTGDWYVWDTARGIVAGNDPYLLLNSTAAEVTGTDYVDTYSAGFEISSTAPAAINANGGSFIFLAIS
jgi:hypothetical protein